MIEDAIVWLGRAIALLPMLRDLWTVVKSPEPDPRGELEASLRLIRKMKDMQAREEIEAP